MAGYWYAATSTMVLLFTEGEVYSYAPCAIEDFNELKASVHRGQFFNFEIRRPNREALPYAKIAEVPPDPDDSWQ